MKPTSHGGKARKSTLDPSEREVQATIVEIARSLGYKMDRRNTGAFSGTYKGKRRYVRFGSPGDSDLTGMIPWQTGRRIDIEVKRTGKRPTAIQVAKLRETIAAGGVAFWTDSVDEARRFLEAIKGGSWIEVEDNGDQFLCNFDS